MPFPTEGGSTPDTDPPDHVADSRPVRKRIATAALVAIALLVVWTVMTRAGSGEHSGLGTVAARPGSFLALCRDVSERVVTTSGPDALPARLQVAITGGELTDIAAETRHYAFEIIPAVTTPGSGSQRSITYQGDVLWLSGAPDQSLKDETAPASWRGELVGNGFLIRVSVVNGSLAELSDVLRGLVPVSPDQWRAYAAAHPPDPSHQQANVGIPPSCA